jgi:hypothetical protein
MQAAAIGEGGLTAGIRTRYVSWFLTLILTWRYWVIWSSVLMSITASSSADVHWHGFALISSPSRIFTLMLSLYVQTCDNGEGGSAPPEVSYFFSILTLHFLTSSCTAVFNIPLTHSNVRPLARHLSPPTAPFEGARHWNASSFLLESL